MQSGGLGLNADFDALRAWARDLTRGYSGEGFDPRKEADYKQAKRDRTYFNGLVKDIDQRRKAVKAAYSAPLKEFEDECGSVTAILKGAADQAGAVVAEGDRLYREEKEQALREFFDGFAGELANVASYEQIANPAWLNRLCSLKDAQDDIVRRLNGVARDWEVLARFVGTPGYAAARRAFCKTLDIGEALKARDEANVTDESIKQLDEFGQTTRKMPKSNWAMKVFGASDFEVAQVLQFVSDMGLAASAERQEEDCCDE